MRLERIGLCPIRGLTYIRQAAPHPDRTELRCETCGRAFDCCCGPDCECDVHKELTREESMTVADNLIRLMKEEPDVILGDD